MVGISGKHVGTYKRRGKKKEKEIFKWKLTRLQWQQYKRDINIVMESEVNIKD